MYTQKYIGIFLLFIHVVTHQWIFRYKVTKGGNDGKRRDACLHGKRPAAFRNLYQIGYSNRFPLVTFVLRPFFLSCGVYRKNLPDARSRKASNKRENKNNSKFSDRDRIKVVVYNEYALGYIMPERPNTVYTLADSVLRGAPFRVMLEPYYISSHDTVRLAGRQDFETFKVVFDGYDNTDVYEFDTN